MNPYRFRGRALLAGLLAMGSMLGSKYGGHGPTVYATRRDITPPHIVEALKARAEAKRERRRTRNLMWAASGGIMGTRAVGKGE